MNTPLISHEVPIELFKYHGFINDYPYLLGHLLDSNSTSYNKEYADFYKDAISHFNYSILDNCLDFYTKVTLSDGTRAEIGPIVKKKLPLEVLSMNLRTKKIEPKRIINWCERKDDTTQWYKIYFYGAQKNKKGVKSLICSDNEKI